MSDFIRNKNPRANFREVQSNPFKYLGDVDQKKCQLNAFYQ